MMAGKESPKIPMPPRMTVLSLANGLQAKSQTRLPDDGVRRWISLMHARLESAWLYGRAGAGTDDVNGAETRKAIGLANRVGIVVYTQRQSHPQLRGDPQFILGIEAKTIERDRLAQPGGKVLLETSSV